MTERQDQRCADLLLARRLLAMLCALANVGVWVALVMTATQPLVLRLGALALLSALALLACDWQLSRLRGRDRRHARRES